MAFYTAMAALGGSEYIPIVGSIVQGQRQARQQKRAIAAQEQGQREASSRLIGQQNKNAMANRAANQKMPDILSMLANAQQSASSGSASTVLSPLPGLDPAKLRLGGSQPLGL